MNKTVDELNGKLAQAKMEINDLKLNYQQKCKDAEQA